MVKTAELLDLTRSLTGRFLAGCEYPWQALGRIGEWCRAIGDALPADEFEKRGEDIWIARDAAVYPTAWIAGPCIIGHRTEVRHCAFIRGSAIVGDDCVVGNSVELKNVILFDGVQTPHYNYVGDSILGCGSHMGAGAITSNVKSDKTPVAVKSGGERIETGLKKCGAILGDRVEVGCNCVLNPGTVLGRGVFVYPTSSVRGVVPAGYIWKDREHIVPRV